ncbi:MAG: (d)CMP kinase [Anaerolineae bacterium]
MSRPSTIAIDGFAASGKSTVGQQLAKTLGYLYFDTGVMYRAVTWAVLNRHISPDDAEAASALAESVTITVEPPTVNDGRQNTVRVDGQDITWDIRRADVVTHVSRVSSYPRVRAALTAQQRRIAAPGKVVMVGRDIGTVVLPDADLKVFLLASAEERARRRYAQDIAQNRPADYDAILAGIIARDRQDEANPVSPTKPAPDAVLISTDNVPVEQVIAQIIELATRIANGTK